MTAENSNTDFPKLAQLGEKFELDFYKNSVLVVAMNSKYKVYGWLNGGNFDVGDEASAIVTVMATDEGDAEDKGDTKLRKLVGTCDVIVAEKI